MKALKLNADYESELFYGKPSLLINQSMEFFIFFLTDRPLYTHKKYAQDYLDYIEEKTGRKPIVQSHGSFENWWGLLKNIEQEKWWNSKITSTELSQKWLKNTLVIYSEEELPELTGTMLIKDPFGMSGQKFQLSHSKPVIKNFPVIIEPLLKRKYDFAQYVFPDGKIIAYQNLVDEKFQYKGTIFNGEATLENLSFYTEVDSSEWKTYQEQTKEIVAHYSRYPNEIGYSIDSFVYEEEGKLKIRALSEVNYRRTMGRMAYELKEKYTQSPWASLQLLKPSSTPLWMKFKNEEDILVLTSGDLRFEVVLISDPTKQKLLSHS